MIKQSEINRRVRDVLDANPDLPIMLLVNDVYGDDFDSHYHHPSGAMVTGILIPHEVEELYGDAFGLEHDRWYDDPDEVAELIEDSWLWDGGHGRELQRLQGTRTCAPKEWLEVYRPIADMMAADMPWHKHVIIYGD